MALPGAVLRFREVPGAYYRGTRVPVSEGGREIYCRVPPGWEELYDIPPNSVIEVAGNMPGLRTAKQELPGLGSTTNSCSLWA